MVEVFFLRRKSMLFSLCEPNKGSSHFTDLSAASINDRPLHHLQRLLLNRMGESAVRGTGAFQPRRRRSGDSPMQLDLPLSNLARKPDSDELLCEKPETTETASAEGKEILRQVLSEAIQENRETDAGLEGHEALAMRARKMEAMGTLASGIAHDFNNILTPILLRTEMAMTELQQDSPLRFQLEQVLTCGQRARDLVHQILNFSHQTGRERQPLQISLVVKEVLKLLRSAFPSSMEIRQDIAGSGMVLADLSSIHLLVTELCVKAAGQMGDRGGVLEVSLRDVEVGSRESGPSWDLPAGLYVKLTVRYGESDALIGGCGPADTQEKAPSFAVIRSIVEQHDGRVVAHSNEPKRTACDIFLPRLESAGPSKRTEPLSLPHGTERILLVDDETEVMETFKQMLTYLGYTVFSSTSSPEALEIFRKAPDRFDLLITDQTMPRMTGIELAQEVRRLRPDLPVLLCSGFGDVIRSEEVKSLGVQEVVMKPVTAGEMAHKIRQVLKPGRT
jgi:CheY-like chemotaxis protein